MRKIIILIVTIFCLNMSYAQNSQAVLDEVALIIKAKNEAELNNYLAHDVELSIQDDQYELNKIQALDKIIKFLNQVEINSYDILHISTMEDGELFVIAKLITKEGTYSSSIYLAKIKEKYLIREISFKDEVSTTN